MIDFEKSSRKAARKVWDNTVIHGCMFHFCQVIWKKAKSMKEIAAKVDDKSSHVNSIVRMYTRLSFLPVEKITAGIDSISQYQKIHHLEKDFEEFNKYFTTTWMKVYKASEWCISDQTQRTNNNVEAYNNKIKGLISRNPNVYVFLDGLQSLALDASNQLEDEKENFFFIKDRSKLTEKYRKAKVALKSKKINITTFLLYMSGKLQDMALRNQAL
jgi:hypothetical protein